MFGKVLNKLTNGDILTLTTGTIISAAGIPAVWLTHPTSPGTSEPEISIALTIIAGVATLMTYWMVGCNVASNPAFDPQPKQGKDNGYY